jgi:hypothetical protein
MGIGLMANVPDEPVFRRVEKVVERYRKLDNAKPRTEMPSRDRYSFDQLVSQLVSDLLELIWIEFAKVLRVCDCVEERGAVADCHFYTFLEILLANNLCRTILKGHAIFRRKCETASFMAFRQHGKKLRSIVCRALNNAVR